MGTAGTQVAANELAGLAAARGLLWVRGMMNNLRRLLVLPLLVTAACVDDEVDTGSVAVELTAAGPDGSIYALPHGTRLRVRGVTNPQYFDFIDIDDDVPSVTARLPVGTYEVELHHQFVAVTELPLERTNPDATIDTVAGQLTTPMPASLTIVRQETTAFALSFAVAKHGNLTFGRGTVDVSIDVAEVEATGLELRLAGTFQGGVEVDATAWPALAGGLPTANVDVTMHVEVAGAWMEESEAVVCAPIEVSFADGTHPLLTTLLLDETSAGAPNQKACLIDDGATTTLVIMTNHVGAAVSAAWADAVSDQPFYALVEAVVALPAGIYDGETIDFEALSRATTAAADLLIDVQTDAGRIYFGTFGGSGLCQAVGLLAP